MPSSTRSRLRTLPVHPAAHAPRASQETPSAIAAGMPVNGASAAGSAPRPPYARVKHYL